MNEELENELDDDLRPEYDFANMAGGMRGKYVDSLSETLRERYRAGTNMAPKSDREDTMNADLLARDETARRANDLYEGGIRAVIETEGNIGKMVIIDLETGNYELKPDDRESVQILKQKNPNAQLFGIRIGYDVAVVLGGVLETLPPKK
jgi:hypothetical protein